MFLLIHIDGGLSLPRVRGQPVLRPKKYLILFQYFLHSHKSWEHDASLSNNLNM